MLVEMKNQIILLRRHGMKPRQIAQYRTEAQQQAAMAKRATNQKRRKAEIHADFTIL